MPTTTNYSWTTPADTDLVKDGASAIRTLGTAIDTTTKNLNPETTLGDISYRSSTANTNTRLALGTAGQVLRVNSGATAPEWATLSSTFVGCTLSTTAGQSISNSTITAVTFGSEDIDTDAFHSTVTNTDRITIPSGKGGKYLIYGQVRYDTNSTGRRVVYIQLNNTTDIAVGEDTPGASTKTTIKTSIIYSLAVGDYIRLNTFQTQGTSQSLLTDAGSVLFGVVYLGA